MTIDKFGFSYPTADVVTASYQLGDSIIVASAKKSPSDQDDLQFAMRLAAARCDEKVAEARMKYMRDKFVEVDKEIERLEKDRRLFAKYFNKYADEVNEKHNEIKCILKELD